MANDFIINDDIYLILLRYFDGDIINIDKKTINNLKKGRFQKEEIEPVNKKVIKTLKKILLLQEENPEEYANINWVYPEWGKDTKVVKEKLDKLFPEEYNDEGELQEIKEEGEIETTLGRTYQSIIPQRKAFIEWVNNVFYKELITNFKENPIIGTPNNEDTQINIYQYFVKKYLSIETPFRGLLVYHGLGTGKTATSVVTAEGLSKKMPIYTFLPASLETEYIKEVKSWGDKLYNVDRNNWIFYSINEIKSNLKIRKELNSLYGINETHITQIFNKTKSEMKSSLSKDDPNYSKELSLINKKLTEIKGLFIPISNTKGEYRTIYTVTGEIIDSDIPIDEAVDIIKFEEHHLKYINHEIYTLIKNKYNFIHYNGFPRVDEFNFKNNTGEVLKKDKLTENDKLVIKFAEDYKKNYETYHIESPFKNNVIVIDEVHNFVREIINESGPANIFYNWIINAEDIKIIFLSGTPIINKPAEIAILYNMLRGSLLIYDFTLISDKNEIDIQNDLREYFYKEESSIEQINVSKKKGKIILSFTKTKTNFESIMEEGIIKTIKYNDHDLKSFFNEIFEGLEKMFDKQKIIPNKNQIDELITKGIKIPSVGGHISKRSLKDLKLGNHIIFDEDINIPFNRKQKLFEINENDTTLDLSNNEGFLEYFLDDQFNIIPKKKIFLRRMILGLTSYYPIDRKSIKNMPVIVKPEHTLDRYKDYTIIENINVISCPMSPVQWVNYENEYVKEKLRRLNQLRKKDLYNDKDNSDYSIRTRQNCNIVYEDDSFRKGGDDEKRNEAYDKMRMNGFFSYDGLLNIYSPKFYEILKNIQKFIKDDRPIGKVLYYSDFRKDAGSEAFEKILLANGYEKYKEDEKNIEKLISEGSKKKRYTFITGEESQELRKLNKEAFNHDENVRGEYIQVILISSAGAEGISLKCVRQVHIMEPFWNYIRIDQVFGRAIRMRSHMNPKLPENERNVEQYLYISTLPEGETIETLFTELKDKGWPELEDIENGNDIKLRLLDKHKAVYKTLTKIISMKKETNNRTVDQLLFDIMEKKNIISSNIIDIIKESSVDCIQNSRDDIQLNNKCLRFSDKLKKEESHFPGITSNELNQIDIKQFKSNFLYYIKPDTYVILAKRKSTNKDIYVYYKVEYDGETDIDVRYIRENGIQLCDFDPIRKSFFYYELKEHELNKKLGDKFSVFQSIYRTTPQMTLKIKDSKFPSLKEIKDKDNLSGYIIKYNISEKLFYSPMIDSKINIIKLYDFNQYSMNNYSTKDINYIILRDGKFFKRID